MTKIRVLQDDQEDEYYGVFTEIRLEGVGESRFDPDGEIFTICGRPDDEIIDVVVNALEAYYASKSQ